LKRILPFAIGMLMLSGMLLTQSAPEGTPKPATPDSTLVFYRPQLDSLRVVAAAFGIPSQWLNTCMADTLFKLHPGLDTLFARSAEKKVDHLKEQGVDWYFQRFGVEQKAQLGKVFLTENRELLERVERVHGIRYELVLGILGMETNFAQVRWKGRYYVFNALVSQYVLMPRRRNFALRELKALSDLTTRTGRPNWYFIGSYAGASGWGQFIPSSLQNSFIDADGDDHGLDIYALDDNLFSIENYLFNNGLNRVNQDDPDQRYRAVYSYNKSDAYVRAVLYIYDTLHAWREAGFPSDPPVNATAAPDSLNRGERPSAK
jgi:membrane-bound lytic murein transglycosylase B